MAALEYLEKMNSFDSLGLSAELLRAVAGQGYREPTPVQAQAIPLILQGRDLLARAQTGTGKTAGFTLPLLQRLMAEGVPTGKRKVRALILTPTRELAAQVAQSVAAYGAHLPLRHTVIFGGVNIRPQTAALERGVDIVVATPGRLLDHVQQKNIDLSSVQIFVLDEADRMLDMGFIPAIRRVLALLPKRKQSLLFSATFSTEIKQLATSLLNDPGEVAVAPQNSPAERVEHRIHPVDASRKRALLAHLIATGNWGQVLVFTRTKHGANRLAQQLEQDGLGAAAIHGNKSQAARTKALANFKSGDVRVLVATDIAARGLDIDQLPYVVNYELPHVPEDYVHRIGRTGRAGRSGLAVSLVSADESGQLRGVEALLRQRLESVPVEGFEPSGRSGSDVSRNAVQYAPRNGSARSGRSSPSSGGRSGRPSTSPGSHNGRGQGSRTDGRSASASASADGGRARSASQGRVRAPAAAATGRVEATTGSPDGRTQAPAGARRGRPRRR